MSSPLSPSLLSLCPSPCTQQEQVSWYPAFCLSHYGQQPTKHCCWEITSQTGKSLIDNVSENGRFVCSVSIRRGGFCCQAILVMVTACKRQVLTRGSPQTHKTSQQLPLSCCWRWWCKRQQRSTRTQGWWGGLAIYCPRRKYGFKFRLSYGWSMWCWSNYLLLSVSVPKWNQGSRSLCKSP